MANYESTKIRSLYLALLGLSKVIESSIKVGNSNILYDKVYDQYERFIQKANQDFPGLLVVGDHSDFLSHRNENDRFYYADAIQANIAINLAILKANSEETSQNSVIETKDFSFITDNDLRKILERDYKEIQKNVISSNWKSAIILSGGCIEAILLDLCLQNDAVAVASPKAPIKKPDINDWVLNDLIEVCVDVKLVASEIAKLSHTIREYRNLIHPAVEIKKKLKVEPEEAKIAIEVLNILIRELTP